MALYKFDYYHYYLASKDAAAGMNAGYKGSIDN